MPRGPGELSRASNKTAKHWLYTVFVKPDYDPANTDEYFESIERVFGDRISFLAGQLERAPGTGRLHFQLYIEWHRSVRGGYFGANHEASKGCHYEPREGSPQQAKDYCQKTETRVHGPYQIVCHCKYTHNKSYICYECFTVPDDFSLINMY